MTESVNKRANMIDGLPSTFNTSFIIRSGKKCGICEKRIKKEDISKNIILYTDEFECVHKQCLIKKNIFYQHIRENDFSSPIKLLHSTGKVYKSKKEKVETAPEK
jgi:hypothetical protein